MLNIGKSSYRIDFKYDVEKDCPQKIADEMKAGINLPDEKISAIKKQIEKHVRQNEAAKRKLQQRKKLKGAESGK